MARIRNSGIAVIATVLVVAVAGYFFLAQAARDKARAAAASSANMGVPVTTTVAEKKDMPILVRGLGTVQAYKMVVIKTRVDGEIVKVSFDEGREVKTGDPLFQIDPRPFQAALDQAAANKQRNQALLVDALLELERTAKLVAPGFQTQQKYDQQKSTVDALKAAIIADQAAIDSATLNLAYADIRAPIDGRTGQRLVDLGNLVQAPQATSLVSITQVRPIFVNFTVPQDVTDEIRRNQAKAPLVAMAYSSDDKTRLAEGKLTLIDNQIDTATGTLRLKATYENTDERLWPGQFVNVRLVLGARVGTVTVPQRTVLEGPNGYYAYVVKADNTVERRPVELNGSQDGNVAITKGIEAGERVVVDGQYRLTNGSRVRIDPAGPGAAPAPAAKSG